VPFRRGNASCMRYTSRRADTSVMLFCVAHNDRPRRVRPRRR
jgi:hypothetical protein